MPENGKNNFVSLEPEDGRKALTVLNPARIYADSEQIRCLDPTELSELEQEFRLWAEIPSRSDVRASRKRILLVFLLIRYTGAKLNEVLSLDLDKDLDTGKFVVRFVTSKVNDSHEREVQISSDLMSEMLSTSQDPAFRREVGSLLRIDAGHVRRKFYERATACGFSQDLGAPNAIRKARAVELMRNNMPLPVVQRLLGHSSPNLTASLVSFSDDDINRVAGHFIERESRRKSSARNTFFGKIGSISKGDIQSRIELVTIDGDLVTTVITNNSLQSMGLKPGSLITAEVKAPWVILEKNATKPCCSAENIFRGKITQINSGGLTAEFIVRLRDGSDICSLVTRRSRSKIDLEKGDDVWAMFSSFAVILHVP